MLLDTSNSIRERLNFEKDAAIDFLNNVIRRNKDMAFLMTFDNEPEVIQDYTGDIVAADRRRFESSAPAAARLSMTQSTGPRENLSNPPLPEGRIRKCAACSW